MTTCLVDTRRTRRRVLGLCNRASRAAQGREGLMAPRPGIGASRLLYLGRGYYLPLYCIRVHPSAQFSGLVRVYAGPASQRLLTGSVVLPPVSVAAVHGATHFVHPPLQVSRERVGRITLSQGTESGALFWPANSVAACSSPRLRKTRDWRRGDKPRWGSPGCLRLRGRLSGGG